MASKIVAATLGTIGKIHGILLVTTFIFGALVLVLSVTGGQEIVLFDSEDMLGLIAIFYGFAMIPVSAIVAKSRLKSLLVDKVDLVDKLIVFQSVLIIRLALLEGVTLFSLVAGLMNPTVIGFAIAGLMMGVMAVLRPTPFKIAETLSLNAEERAQLMER